MADHGPRGTSQGIPFHKENLPPLTLYSVVTLVGFVRRLRGTAGTHQLCTHTLTPPPPHFLRHPDRLVEFCRLRTNGRLQISQFAMNAPQ